MAKYQIRNIKSIANTYQQDGYVGACAIDPDVKINNRIAGAISPNGYTSVSSTPENIIWLVPNDYDKDTYYYTNNGEFGKLDTDTSATTLYNFDNAKGNGLGYLNNYYYICVNKDIHRYGPLDNPTLQRNWWTSLVDTEEGGRYVVNVTADTARASADVYAQVVHNLRTRFDKVSVDLKSTSEDPYEITLKIQNVSETSYQIDDGVTFDVDIYEPSGTVLASATLDSTALSTSAFSTQEFTLNQPIYTLNDFAITLEVTDPTAGGSFTVRESDGSVKEGTYLIDKNTNWEKNIVYDNTAETFSVSATFYEEAHSWTISTSQDKITEDVVVEFEVSHSHDATDKAVKLLLNGNVISGSEYFTANRSTPSPGSTMTFWLSTDIDEHIDGFYHILLHPTLELKDGDVLSIEMFAYSDIEEEPKSISIGNKTGGGETKPFFQFEEAADTAIEITTSSNSFLPLGNKTYSTIGAYELPNHSFHFHNDGALYFCNTQTNGAIGKINTGDRLDVIDITDDGEPDGAFSIGDLVRGETSNALGTVLKIDTISTATDEQGLVLTGVIGTFVDGETVIGEATTISGTVSGTLKSGYANIDSDSLALTLPRNYNPVGITSVGTDLLIAANTIEASSLFLWDTFATSFYREVKLPFRKVSAIFSHNGMPYIWGGDDSGYSLYIYSGGETVELINHIDNGYMPLQGAVGAIGNKILWGSTQEYPETRGCVWSWGLKTTKYGLHNIASTDEQISSLNVFDDDGNLLLADSSGLYEKGTTYDSIWRSELISFGRPFNINEIVIPLSKKLTEGETMYVKLWYDNETESKEYTITVDDYPDMYLKLYPPAQGVSNMIIEIRQECDVSVLFPITIDYDITR